MNKQHFKQGDSIIMLEDCSGIKKGEKLEVEESTNYGLIVSCGEDVCTCQDKWKLATPPHKDWDNLQIDDVLVDRNGNKKWVLGVCGKVIFVSRENNHDVFSYWATKQEILKSGYTILQDEEPETIEISGVKYNKQVVDDFLKSIK